MRSMTDEGRAADQRFVAVAAPSPRTEVGKSRLRVAPCCAGATFSRFTGEGMRDAHFPSIADTLIRR